MDNIIARAASPAVHPPLPGAPSAVQPLPWDLASADYLERLFADAQGNAPYGALADINGAPVTARRRGRSNRGLRI